MLREALDHLASLDYADYKVPIQSTTYQTTTIMPTQTEPVMYTDNIQQQTSTNKIVFPRNIVDRAIDFLKTPFSAETKHRLRYQRSVIP